MYMSAFASSARLYGICDFIIAIKCENLTNDIGIKH